MTIVHGYLSYERLALTLNAKTTVKQTDYEQSIGTASRIVDGICSCPELNVVRHFWRDPTPLQRVYTAADPHRVRVGDFADPSAMVVEVWKNNAWDPLGPDQWQPEPHTLVDGFPYTTITATGYAPLFPVGLRAMVRCTTRWGWLAEPDAAGTSSLILAVALLQGIDVISNEDGYSLGRTGPTNPFDLARTALDPYIPEEVKAYRAAKDAA